jgi:4-aminobutyrate aminotransferase-like enzyme
MLSRLRELLADFDQVGEVRGIGFMQGVELVEDSRSKRPNAELRNRIVRNCVFNQRLWILGAGRSSIRLLPALNTSEEEAMEAVNRLAKAVAEEIGANQTTQGTATAAH